MATARSTKEDTGECYTPSQCPAPRSEVEEQHVCLATLEDRDAVIAIDEDIYYGRDFLPATYSSLVKDQGVYGHIYKIGNRVVSFTSVEIVDGGQTVVTSGGRVSPDCRGSGVYGRFTRQVLQNYTSLPGIRYLAFTTNNINMDANGAKILKTYKLILEKEVFAVEVDGSAMDSSISEQSVPGVRSLTEKDIRKLLSADPGQLRHLFPEERIVLGWKPFRLMVSNLHHLLTYSSTPRLFLASIAGNERLEDVISTPLLSCASFYPCKLGVCYMLDVFGNGNSQQLLAHFEWHVRQLHGIVGKGNALFNVFFSRSVEGEMKLMRENHPFIHDVQHRPYNKLVLLEQEL